jgi:cell division septum initiation protein DivIVA
MAAASSIRDGGQIRDATLPRSLRGFDEAATRSFLEEVGEAFDSVRKERDALLNELESLRRARVSEVPTAESIGNALIAANRAADDLVAEATNKAAQVVAEAEAERERIFQQMRTAAIEVEREVGLARSELEEERHALQAEKDQWQKQIESERATVLAEAQARAEGLVAEAQANLAMLREEAAQLQAFTIAKRNEFVELTRTTLERLDKLDAEAFAETRHRQILEDLRPTPESGAAMADRPTTSAQPE